MTESIIEEKHGFQVDDKVAFWAESLQSSVLVISENEEVLFSNATCTREFQISKNEFIIFEKQQGKINRIRKLKDPISKENWIKVSSLLDLEYLGEEAHLVIIEKPPVMEQRETNLNQAEIEPLLGIMPGVVYRCLNEESRVMQYLSEGCYQLTGYSAESFIGKREFPYSSLIHTEDYWRTWKEIQTALSENRPYKITYRLKHGSGEIHTVQEQGKGVFNGEGKIVALEGWIIDVSDQKKVEEALVESEMHYRNLIEVSPDGVVLMGLEGEILFANHQLALMLACDKNSSLMGKKVLDFLVPGSRSVAFAEIAHFKGGDTIHRGNYQVKKVNGRVFPVETNVRMIANKQGSPLAYIAVVRDVSEREETLQALKNNEARYRAIVEDNPEMIVRFKPNGIITFVNQAYSTYAGVPPSQLIGERLPDFSSGDAKQTNDRLLTFISPDMAPDVTEQVRITTTGEQNWYRWKTQPIRNDEGSFIEYQSIGENITDEKKAEQANLRSEIHLRTLMESIKLYAITLDLQGNMTFCNSHFLESTGWQKDEALGKNWFEQFVPAESAQKLKNELLDQATSGLIPQRSESFILTKSKEQILVSWNNTLLKNDQGNVTAIASIGEDITEKFFAEKTQAVIYKIAQSTIAARDLDELFRSIHMVLMDLMPADNFFIALYDAEADLLTFPYFIDQFDKAPLPKKPSNGLTEYVLRTGKPLLVSPEIFEKLENDNEVGSNGTPSIDWMGIPLLIEDRAIGVMVMQTYSEGIRFKKRDEQMLTFVSTQVAMAIDRKRAEQALKSSTKRNELLIQSSTDCIFLESLSGEILDCNTIAEEIYGYTREELMSMNVVDLVLRSFTEDKPDYVNWQIDQGGRFSDIPNIRKDGSVFPVEVSTKITDISGNKVAVAYVRDITERKQSESAILESESKFKTLAQTAAAGIFIHRDSQFLYVNPMWCEITGFSESELLQKSLWEMFNHENEDLVRKKYAELVHAESGMVRFESAIDTRAGEKIWLDITAGNIDYQGEKATIGTAIDITHRKHREHDLEVVAQLSDALRTNLTREQVRTTVLEQLMDLLTIDGAMISTVEKREDLPNFLRTTGCWAPADNQKLKVNEGLSGFIVGSGKAYTNFCASKDPYFAFPELLTNLVTLAGVPLVTKGETFGSIVIGSSRKLVEDELRLLKTIGDLASSAIHRSDLYEQTSAQASELKQAYNATLEGWAHALELRDKETQGHSLRITNMTLELARRMGFENENLEHVRRGALLHDIGKMGVPDTILLKPGSLTEDEWAIMQKHPIYAHEMLSELPYFKEALDIPYCHHEWWDGSGYPRGLKGTDIPLPARIFAIVDAWDALVSDRPYRKAWVKQNALKHIIDQAGTHFDESVVNVFVEMLKEQGI